VRANAVAPGYIQTALTEVLPEDVQQAILANTPLARLGTPEDVAGAVRFLCSDEASFLTGGGALGAGGGRDVDECKRSGKSRDHWDGGGDPPRQRRVHQLEEPDGGRVRCGTDHAV